MYNVIELRERVGKHQCIDTGTGTGGPESRVPSLVAGGASTTNNPHGRAMLPF
jgi:hypothetical protein